MAATAALVLTEQLRPGWVTPYAEPGQRLVDVAGNLVFVQVLAGVLVLVLARNLNQERAKSERLLRNVLPEQIAQELQQTDRVLPREYADASVLFTDFVGFTGLAERLTPQELIGELDDCFRRFDEVARRHGLEKIKTVGDSYMAVGGIPGPNQTHAVDCVLAALAFQRLMEEPGRSRWRLRIGIHSGGLVAGVIGREKFAYDVWGDTVNTASRLESAGEANRVNISAATYERVKDFFVCEPRDKVSAKNKGALEMYFVKGLRPELSEAGAGRTRTNLFFDRYARLAQGPASSSPPGLSARSLPSTPD
jgi:adenylate cyclase